MLFACGLYKNELAALSFIFTESSGANCDIKDLLYMPYTIKVSSIRNILSWLLIRNVDCFKVAGQKDGCFPLVLVYSRYKQCFCSFQ